MIRPRKKLFLLIIFIFTQNLCHSNSEKDEKSKSITESPDTYLPPERPLQFSQPINQLTDLNRIVREFGEKTNVTLADVKTLDPNLPTTEIEILKQHRPDFVVGWLSDKVIDFAIHELCNRQTPRMVQNECSTCAQKSKVLCLQSSLSQLLDHDENSVQFHFSEAARSYYDRILMPCNPSRYHWVLFAVDKSNRILRIFNPPIAPTDNLASLTMSRYAIKFRKILYKLTGKIYTSEVTNLSAGCMVDCGVHVIHYAKCFMDGADVSNNFSAMDYRRSIYESLISNPLSNDQISNQLSDNLISDQSSRNPVSDIIADNPEK